MFSVILYLDGLYLWIWFHTLSFILSTKQQHYISMKVWKLSQREEEGKLMFSSHYYCPRLCVDHYPTIQRPLWLHPTRQRPHSLGSKLHQVHVAVAMSTLAIPIKRRIRQFYNRKQWWFQDGRVFITPGWDGFYHLFVFTIEQALVIFSFFSQEINVNFCLEDHLPF